MIKLFFDSSLSFAGSLAHFGGITLNSPTCCNWRAGLFLFVVPMALLALVVPVLGEGTLYDPTGVGGDLFGQSMTEIADMNGDGFDEFLVGVAASASGGTDAGEVFLWFGGNSVFREPDRIWTGTAPELFGWSVANIGDVNNDGTEDWAVGAPLSNAGGTERGRVCVFYGGANPSSSPDVIISGGSGGDQFGYAISAAGDFNGDGKDDFIVGAPYSDLRAGDAGAAYVIYGSNSGPSSNLADATALAGEAFEDNFGWSVSDAGNFLGGADCVAIGAPLSNTHGGLDGGAVYVFEGAAAPDTTIDFVAGISASSKAGSWFGFSVRGVGRLDGDSNDDLAVGAPSYLSERGRVEIFYGGLNPSVVADHAIDGVTGSDSFGWSLDRAGNIEGSGADDVLIGAPYHDSIASDGGQAYIYPGGSSITNASSLTKVVNPLIEPGTAAGDHYGLAVASAGDFDGDGILDYAVSAPSGNTANSATAGYVILVHSSGGPVANVLQSWQAQWQGSHEVELNFAVSYVADTVAEVLLTRQLSDVDGVVRGEQLLWSGPARAADDGTASTLYRQGNGFGFRDDLSGVLVADYSIDYGVTIVTEDGESLNLGLLAGPAGQPSLPVLAADFLALAPAWPNPANPAVTIRFRAASSDVATVQILDVRGRLVRELHRAVGTGDWQNVIWNGLTDGGQAAASGVYLINLKAGQALRTERVVLAR